MGTNSTEASDVGEVELVGSKLVGHSATEHAAASQSGSGMACATDGVMSRSRSPVRRNSVDGAPEHAEKADYSASSSDAGGAAEHAAVPQSGCGIVSAMTCRSEAPIGILLKLPKHLSSGKLLSSLSSAASEFNSWSWSHWPL